MNSNSKIPPVFSNSSNIYSQPKKYELRAWLSKSGCDDTTPMHILTSEGSGSFKHNDDLSTLKIKPGTKLTTYHDGGQKGGYFIFKTPGDYCDLSNLYMNKNTREICKGTFCGWQSDNEKVNVNNNQSSYKIEWDKNVINTDPQVIEQCCGLIPNNQTGDFTQKVCNAQGYTDGNSKCDQENAIRCYNKNWPNQCLQNDRLATDQGKIWLQSYCNSESNKNKPECGCFNDDKFNEYKRNLERKCQKIEQLGGVCNIGEKRRECILDECLESTGYKIYTGNQSARCADTNIINCVNQINDSNINADNISMECKAILNINNPPPPPVEPPIGPVDPPIRPVDPPIGPVEPPIGPVEPPKKKTNWYLYIGIGVGVLILIIILLLII